MILTKVESMISVGLPSRRLQGIWARERTGGAKGTLALACLLYHTTQARFPYTRTHAEKK